MPSGGKGSKPAGNTVTTTINPTQQTQLPFLTGGAGANSPTGNVNVGWNQAYNLATGNPYQYYPGQTLANFNPYLPAGYNQMGAAATNASDTLLPQGNSLFSSAANGGMGIYGSPAFGGLSDIASGTNAYLKQAEANIGGLSAVGNQAAANPYAGLLSNIAAQAAGPNDAMDALRKTSSGAYLNSNPYLDSMFGSASNAVTRAYETATAPQTASNFAMSGRYGSGAYGGQAGAVSQNEQNLGSSLGNLSANIYGGNYQAERGRQDAASQALGSLIAQNIGLQGSLTSAAGQQYLGGLGQAADDYAKGGQLDIANVGAQQNALSGLQSGYQAGNNNQMQALALFPSLLGAQYGPSQAMVQAGQGLTGLDQQQIQDQMSRFYGNISAPWQTNQAYLNQVGQPTTGSSQTQQPYFQNQLANLLGGATGGLGLYNGVSGALGKGGGSGAAASGFGGVSGVGIENLMGLGAGSAAEGLAASTGLDFGTLAMMALI